jgi:hypothetical protein
VFGVILVGDGRAIESHDLVTDKLVDRTPVSLDHRHQLLKAGIHQVAHGLGIHALRHCGESRDVGKHHGDQLALSV